jgi:hypothetical protein
LPRGPVDEAVTAGGERIEREQTAASSTSPGTAIAPSRIDAASGVRWPAASTQVAVP